jgi:nicotinate-nucleotide pyrophosphorylase (carboxylating)
MNVDTLIDLALEEDLGRGDVTSAAIFAGDGGPARAVLLAKQSLVVFGLELVARVFARVDPAIRVRPHVADGAQVEPRTILADIDGSTTAILAGERVALNFLQRLSGVATMSARFAAAVAGTRARVVDTRKTTPGWRALEKAAVRAGGCANHRADLGSGILIKDNHVAAAGGVTTAVARARAHAPHTLRVEVEVITFAQLEEALAAGAEIVLLDNMDVPLLEQCIARAHAAGVLVEVSGGVRLDTVAGIARLGPDLISAGAITHSAPAVDISLEIVSGARPAGEGVA